MINNMEFELYLIRHGQSETNALPDQMGQDPDVPLTKLGKHQAELLKNKFNKEEKEFDFVFSSPYKRAMDTAMIVIPESQPIIAASRLREYDAGDWTGCSRKTILTKDVKLRMGYLDNNFLPPNGESLSMVERRSASWLEDAILYNTGMQKAAQEKLNEGKILSLAAFCHGMTIKTLLHYIMGFDKSFTWKVAIANTSVTRVSFGQIGWGLITINDCTHLFGEEFDIYCPEVKNGS